MSNFKKMKSFFAERADKFVHYTVFGKDEIANRRDLPNFVAEKILNNPSVKDFFGIEFPYSSPNGEICIDSLDSFVFDFYFLDFGDKIAITDANRSFDCGVDAFEGNGTLFTHRDEIDDYLKANGAFWSDCALFKNTSADTFVSDAITFAKVLQTLNNAQPFPPFVLELDATKELVDALTRAWVKDESIHGENRNLSEIFKGDDKSLSSEDLVAKLRPRKLAVFDNDKALCQGFSCDENAYCEHFNTHAFKGIFFNSLGEVLICKNLKKTDKPYDFAISDFVLDGETCSLESLQRAVKERFGFGFSFGDFAPAITTTKNKVITDFFVVNGYDVSLGDVAPESKIFTFEWAKKDRLISLIKTGEFANYSLTFIDYLYELKD